MLTDGCIKTLTPRDRPYKVADSKGLYLYVTPTGSKSWRFKYRQGGREHRLTFGLYPMIDLDRARRRRDAARVLISAKQDPRSALHFEARRDAAQYLLPLDDGAGDARVYFVRAADGRIKIGVTRNLRRRLAQLQMFSAAPLELMGSIAGGYAVEGSVHRLFAESAVGGEWFAPSPRLLEFIDENAAAGEWR